MGLIVLPDVILPNSIIEAGVRGKQARRNSRVVTDNGQQFTKIVWTQTLRQYEIGIGPMQRAAWQDVETLHEVTEGGAYGFLLEDPKDNAATVDEGIVAALSATTFQAMKRYQHAPSGRYHDRKITRLRAAGLVVYVDGVPTGAYTLDEETGILTIASAPDPADVQWSGRFYVPVQFVDDSIDWELVVGGPSTDRRFIAGPSCLLQEVRE